jgi:ABC-type sugar transport system substrate-binding protein
MNVLKRTSARPGATFGLPILLSAAILVAHGSSVRAADTLGVDIAGLSNSNFSASDQAHAVQTIMAKKPSGIVTWPINPDELSPALKKAAEAGVNSR